MRVHGISLGRSPRAPAYVRLRAQVDYESDPGGSEEYWLDVPERHADAIVTTGDPWLIWLAPLAVTIGERLRLDAPVDGQLLTNVREVVRIWRSWYSHLRDAPIEAAASTDVATGAERVGAFFSGGVDSFFTAFRHGTSDAIDGVEIDALIFVWGFDIDVSNERAWATALNANTTVAGELGATLLPVVTNVRKTRFGTANWTFLAHGAALAGVAHALGGMFRTVLIPSSASYRDLRPWGSHPRTDQLFSSGRLRIVHDGAEYRRVEKTESIARSPLALRHLRVCYQSSDGTNCGECKRCYRTMLALEVLGVLEHTATFVRGALDLRRAEQMFCRDEPDLKQFGFVRELAVREGRLDVVRAIDRSIEGSSRLLRVVARVRRLRDAPVLWRWAPAWERRLLRGWVV